MRHPLPGSWLTSAFALLASLAVPCAAKAAEPEVDAPDQDPLISNGTAAQNCQYPTTVLMFGNGAICTGTLIHPRIVVFAAHCNYVNEVVFGEGFNSVKRTVPVDMCMRNPNWDPNLNNGVNGEDYAFCRLSQAVNDVPITPPVYGCELDMLQANAPATIVGFGNNSGDNGAGTKRWAETIIQTPVFQDSEIVAVGANGTAACNGDSGGPAYFQYPDGSWHTFGIVSGGPPCGSGADTYSLVHRAVPFIEENSGIDVTPCHEVGGQWNPGPGCGGFATVLDNSGVSWNSGCSTPLSGLLETCGPAYGSPPDNNPPSVAIVTPANGTMLAPGEEIDIVVEASDAEFGIEAVGLLIDGELITTDEDEPWVFAKASFPAGTYELVAIAEDYGNNVTNSATVTVIVGDGGDTGDGDGDSGDGDSGDGDSGDGDGDSGSGEAGDSTGLDTTGFDTGFSGGGFDDGGGAGGCACASTGRTGEGLASFGLGLLVLLSLRRRRQSYSGAPGTPITTRWISSP